jgi:pimeloyl-ACP methyl ester carboxylesterase
MTRQFVTSTDGIRLAVHESGRADGPVVVAVHGFPDNHAVWEGLARELGDEFRFVRYDVRGSGDSDKPSGRAAYRIDRLSDDLAAVLDVVSPDEPVHLIGHDWGSVQLWQPLSEPRFAGRVASFTSISGPSLDHIGAWARKRRRALPQLRQLLASTYVAAFQLPVLPEAVMSRVPVERVAGHSFARSRADKTNAINLYRANVVPRLLRPSPGRVKQPVLVLVPEGDPYLRRETVTEAPAPYVDDLTIEDVAGGHWVVSEQPGLVAARFRAFVARASGSGAGSGAGAAG